jgi:molybdate transport system substrate-binding protein
VSYFRTIFLFVILIPFQALAEDGLTIAVASNFQRTAAAIAAEFSQSTQIPVRISAGSTGRLYAQIVNGAPYDVFLAADSARPKRLEDEGLAATGSRLTYAVGSLLLWSADTTLDEGECLEALKSGSYRRLAIANPLTAPYGLAAQEFLQAANLYDAALSRLVYGENIAQALHFVASGNATLGLVSASQINLDIPVETRCAWEVPRHMHSEIVQQGVVLNASASPEAAMKFMAFLQGPRVAAILKGHGYKAPE